jgi:hypothetical protein
LALILTNLLKLKKVQELGQRDFDRGLKENHLTNPKKKKKPKGKYLNKTSNRWGLGVPHNLFIELKKPDSAENSREKEVTPC